MAWVWGVLVAISDILEHHIAAITAVIAVAAVIQWRETRKTDERQLRAYILNSSATLFDGTSLPQAFVNRAGQPGVALEIKNHGQTPAYQVRHACEIQIGPISNESRMFIPAGLGGTGFILGPSATSNSYRWLNRPITALEQAAVIAGTAAIYAYGRIEYLDAFKKRRWSTYRLRHSGNAWPPVAGTASVGMDFCSEGTDGN